MPLRFPRGTMAVLLSATIGWVISCSGEQQPETPPTTAQAQDTIVPPHLRDFAADTSAPFIAVVRNELAHALERHRDDKAVNPTSVTDTAAYILALHGALNRIDALLGGRLKPRLLGAGFDTTISHTYAKVQFHLARTAPGWAANDDQSLIQREGALLTYSGTRALHTTQEAQSIDTDAKFDNGQFHKLAVIESFKAQPEYQPLGIPAATNDTSLCLYLSISNGFITKCGASSYPVTDPPVPLTLRVKRTPHPDREVPAVSRWEWSRQANQNTIGVRCGQSWCQVAQESFNLAHHEPQDPSLDEPNGKQSHVLGWYDVQVLAMKTNAELTPKGPRGLLRPLQALEDSLNTDQPVRDRFVTIAELKLYSAPLAGSKYEEWGLGNGWNRLAICHGPRDKCDNVVPTNENVCEANTDADGRRWYLRVSKRGSSNQNKYHCLKFHPDEPGAASFPSITRWMWDPNDEGMWIRCPAGCCQKT